MAIVCVKKCEYKRSKQMKRFVEFVSVRFNVLCASLCVATSVLAMLASSVAAETSGAFIGAEIGMSGGGGGKI